MGKTRNFRLVTVAFLFFAVLPPGFLATAGTGEMKSAPRWAFAEAPVDVGERPYATPADVIPDHAGFTVSATFVFGPYADDTGVELFSQRTAETGWSLSGQQSARSGRRAVLNVNGVPYSLGSFHERDGKPHEWTVTARRGSVVVYRDGAVLSRVYATIVPNLEPIKVGGPVPGQKHLKPVVGTKLVKMRVWGKDEEYFAKGEPTGFAAGKIGGKGWMISLPKNANDKDLPGLLYFGDSISHGYTGPLVKNLGEKARLYHWSGFFYGVNANAPAIEAATAACLPLKMIVFNNGLHSLHALWQKATDEQAKQVYRDAVKAFRRAAPKAKLVYLNTTPQTGRKNAEGKVTDLGELNYMVLRLNRLAAEVMAEENVPVIDAYSLLVNRLDEAAGDGYHWKAPAYRLLADEITRAFGTGATSSATVIRGLAPEAARDEIRRMKAEGRFPSDGVVVELEGVIDCSERTFSLGKDDGGVSPSARVIYRAGPRGAVFTGARRIPRTAFRPVSDPAVLARLQPAARGKVLCCDLRPYGVTKLPPLPDVIHAWDGMELFCDGEPQTLARYPNAGWLTFGWDDVVERGVKADRARGEWEFGYKGGTFRYRETDDRPARWDLSKDVFAHGFWCCDWASDSLKLAKVNPERREITTKGWHYLGIGPRNAHVKEPRRYFVYNLLEELDAPGEWYVDRTALVLYFLPKEGTAGDCALVYRDAPLVSVDGASYLTFEGVKFTENVGVAFRAKNCESLTLDGVEVSQITRVGVSVSGGAHGLFRRLKVHHTGGRGFELSGGDRRRLVRCDHRVTECDLSRSGRIVSNASCLNVVGCGIRVDHNYIHDAPYITMTYGGNDHLIEFNEIAFAMMESGDGGGLYTGRDWTSQGNVVRWNYLHHFGASGAKHKLAKGEPLFCEPLKRDDSSGIYLDDCDSGDTCVSNLLYKVGLGFLVGGGRDNLVLGNVIVGCERAAVEIDARGLNRLRLGDGTNDGWDMVKKLEAVRYLEDPWASRYPWMKDYLTNDKLMPVRTAYRRNVAVGCAEFTVGGWCKEREFFAKEMDFSGNVSFGPRGKRDDVLYPTNGVGVAARCDFRRDAELERLAASCEDGRVLMRSPEFRRSYPDLPDLPVAEMGCRITEF